MKNLKNIIALFFTAALCFSLFFQSVAGAENTQTEPSYDMREVKELLAALQADTKVKPPTQEENMRCDAAFGDNVSNTYSAQEYEGVGAIGSVQYCWSLTADNGWEHADIDVFDWWEGYPDGWTKVDTWRRGVIGTNGTPAYCLEAGAEYIAEDRLVHNARDYYSQEVITELALVCKYIEDIADEDFMKWANDDGTKAITQAYAGKYYVKQVLLWNIMEQYYPRYEGYHDIEFALSNTYISHGFLGWVIPGAINYARENKDKYTGYGKVLYNEGTTYQRVGVFQAVPDYGSIELRKASGKPEFTDGNDCYSLEGAKYGIYQRNTEEQIAEIVTDANGYGRADNIPPGEYEVRELESPRGYAISRTTGNVVVKADETAVYACTDAPQYAPVEVLLEKTDKETKQQKAQGNASLEHAEFTVKYYGGLSDTDPAQQGKKPRRTWTLKTDARGICRLENSYKISGDDFYEAEGVPVLPLGTLTIQETKAPKGYLLNPELFVRKITSQGNAEKVQTYNSPTVPEQVQKGVIRLQKTDAETETGKGSSALGTLKGAVYEVFHATGEKADTLTTDEEGKAQSRELPVGVYTIKEKTPSLGYVLDTKTYTVTFEGDSSNTPLLYKDVTSRETPQKGVIRLEKKDRDSDRAEPQGKGSLKGAVYEIINDAGKTADTLITDEKGKAESKELSLGSYKVKEKTPSPGYELDLSVYTVKLTSENRENRVFYQTAVSKEAVIRGGVLVEKWDSETDKKEPQGAASLAGAEFQLISQNENSVLVNGKAYKKGEVITTLVTDKKGQASTKTDYLPYGTYQLKESAPPKGYNNTGVMTRTFQIQKQGETVKLNTADTAIKNEVIRGDVQIAKFGSDQEGEDNDVKKPLKDIQFIFTSKTTGKKYTIVTDENGYASTRQLGNPRGGLAYDTYRVTEKSPYQDYGIIKPFEVTIAEQSKTMYYIIENDVLETPVAVVKKDAETGRIIPAAGTKFQILNEEKQVMKMTVTRYPSLVVQSTWETDETGSFLLPEKLKAGKYYLKETEAPKGYLKGGLLPFEVTGEGDWEKPLTVEYADSPVKGNIVIEKTSEATGEKLAGAVFSIYAAEDIVTPDGAVHAVKGEAVDTVTTDKEGKAVSKALYLGKYRVQESKPAPGFALSDKTYEAELQYKNQTTSLVTEKLEITNKPTTVIIEKREAGSKKRLPGVKFEVWNKDMSEEADPDVLQKQTLLTGEDGKARLEGLLPGSYCIQETEGIAGYVMDHRVHEFTVDEKGRADGKEELTLIIENARTEITGTTAVNLDTGSREGIAKKDTRIKDKILFKNLQTGAQVRIKTTLMDKDTGKELLIDGKPVTAEQSFTAEQPNQAVETVLAFDASALAGKTAVVFEKAFMGDTLIASHEDLEDKDQTVAFLIHKIRTRAKEKDSQGKQAVPKEKTVIIDTVEYEGLLTGQEYTIKGVLMDKSTGKELLIDGKPVTAEKSFQTEKKTGSTDLEFSFDSRGLEGKEVVVFERLYLQETETAAHTDLQDKNQTIAFQNPENPVSEKSKSEKPKSEKPKTEKPEAPAKTAKTIKTVETVKTVKTGDESKGALYGLLAGGSGAALLAGLFARQKRRKAGTGESSGKKTSNYGKK